MSEPIPSENSLLFRVLVPVAAVLLVLAVFGIGSWLLEDQPVAPIPARRLAQARVAEAAEAPAPVVSTASSKLVSPAATETVASTSKSPAKQKPAFGPPVATAAIYTRTAGQPLIDPAPAMAAMAPGERASARVTVDGERTPALMPNQLGAFPRVYIAQGGRADVQVQLPDADAGDVVVASIQDGGRFADGSPVQALKLDDRLEASFQFQASQSPGYYRVNLRHNAQTKVVTFWAGDPALAANR